MSHSPRQKAWNRLAPKPEPEPKTSWWADVPAQDFYAVAREKQAQWAPIDPEIVAKGQQRSQRIR